MDESTAVRALSGACPTPVERAAMVQWWDDLTFLHWAYQPADVQRLLPPGLTVETFDGKAWVGLVPFFLRVGLPGVRPIPWMSRFPETNVRTYVVGPDGTPGVWFFSLDAARLGAVVVARSSYRLPYHWAGMDLSRAGDVVRYRCRRRWPGPPAASRVSVRVGAPITASNERDRFLTARWALFSAPRSGLRRAAASHEPWPLHHAELIDLDDSLVAAVGLGTPTGSPIVHWSPSVEVRIGWPQRAGSR